MRFTSFIFAPGLIAALVLLEASPIAIKADVSATLPVLGLFKTYINFEALVNPPRQWSYQEPAPADAKISLRIGLKLQNVERFRQMVIDLSTPCHPTYGQYMTQDEINAIINPKEKSVQLVLEWLKSAGIPAIHDGHSVKAEVTVAQAQVLLQTQFGVYLNTLTSKTAIRTLSYRLPEILKDHVDLVQPTTMFGLELLTPRVSTEDLKRPAVPAVMENEPSRADCDHGVTPQCLMDLYKITGVTPHSNNATIIGVGGFLNEYGNRADLQKFFKDYRPEFLGREYRTLSVNGGLDDQTKPGTEANLDIQYTAGLMTPEAVTYYTVGGSPPFKADANTPSNTNEPYEEFVDYLLAKHKKYTEAPVGMKDESDRLPATISLSYADFEQTVPKTYAERVCDLFTQLGAMGTTVLAASGDFGVGGPTDPGPEKCFSNDGTETTKFMPLFPASCPFVTTVGATVGISPEKAVNFTGGGFSEYFAQPNYQSKHVEGYLDGIGTKYSGLFRPEGRAYPDVAAQGYQFQVYVNGKVESVSGTSASTPVFATIVWYLNDERVSRGLPTMGFLNPLLYSYPHALNDIVLGNNPGCGTKGFDAVAGWDPVTGLGTPDLTKLKEVSVLCT
ncbi:hypothetical protein EC968_007539 [Mortierella alpina]|nr:hypothetical protein EC968_007539 [Mortierella alpina]